MQILQTIEEIIRREFKLSVVGGSYTLEEPSINGYPSTPVKQKGKMLIYSFDVADSNTSVFPIFNSSVRHLTKICDYIIFYPKDEILYTFICDLKSNASSAKKQVEAGRVLSDYIIQMARKQIKFQEVDTEFRSLVISRSATAKPATSVKKERWVILGDSKLKNRLVKAGSTIFLDNFCY